MIVVDASTAVLGLLNDGDARRLLATESVVAPHLIDAEVVHALRGQVLGGVLEATTAERALAVWTRLGLRRVGISGLLTRIWELRTNFSAYDATYVAIAEALDAPLVTADRRLARAPGARCAITVVPR